MALLGDRRKGVPAGHEVSPNDDTLWVSLVRRIQQGDRDAEAELASEFFERILLLASIRLNGSDAALDIAQDTIIATIEALRAGKLHAPASLPSFILGIARNLVNNHNRRKARSRELHDVPDQPALMETPLATLEHERRSLVRQSVKDLSALDRRILLLTLFDGMTPREIAPLVGLEPEAVRTRKCRAVKAVIEGIEKLTRKRRLNHLYTDGAAR